MNTRDERYSVLLLDLGMGVLPTPEGTAFTPVTRRRRR